MGCPFYVSFTMDSNNPGKYRCSGINADHICIRDPETVARYYQYRTQDPVVCQRAAIMLNNGIKANQIAGVIYDEHRGEIQPRDIHRIQQTNWENAKSLSDSNLSTSEMQNLIAEINKNNDKYRIKFKGNTSVMDCFFYWNPANVQFARHFCQVYPSMI